MRSWNNEAEHVVNVTLAIFTEITERTQRHGYSEIDGDQSQVYSEIDVDPHDAAADGDSVGVEKNPAYIAELSLSQAPVSHAYANERVILNGTPVHGEGVEEETERVESRVEEEDEEKEEEEKEEEEEDVTYYTPMAAGELEENGMSVQSGVILEEEEHDIMSMAEGALLQAFHGLG